MYIALGSILSLIFIGIAILSIWLDMTVLGIFCLGGAAFSIWGMIVSQRERNQQKAEAKKRSEAIKKMTPQERKDYFFQRVTKTECCPSCKTKLSYYDTTTHTLVNNWKLVSSHTITEQKLDSIYRLGGASTAFYTNEKKVTNGYQCPNCGFIKYE
jgi:hypothetical protein